jgi:hypothetical protein
MKLKFMIISWSVLCIFDHISHTSSKTSICTVVRKARHNHSHEKHCDVPVESLDLGDSLMGLNPCFALIVRVPTDRLFNLSVP